MNNVYFTSGEKLFNILKEACGENLQDLALIGPVVSETWLRSKDFHRVFWLTELPTDIGSLFQLLQNMSRLVIASLFLGPEDVGLLPGHLGKLNSLDLYYNEIGDEGAKAIAANLANLTSLDLDLNPIMVRSPG